MSLEVVLSNELDRPVDVYWVSNAATEALTVPNLLPGRKTSLNTYSGHAFFFSEAGKGRDEILSTVIMEAGKEFYEVSPETVASSTFRAMATQTGSDDDAGGGGGGDGSKCVDRKPFCVLNAQRGECDVNPG